MVRCLVSVFAESPECICKHGDQTTDHLIYDCEILDKEREKPIAYTSREEDWPVRKCELVNKYLKQITTFANSIDFEKLKWKGRKAKAQNIQEQETSTINNHINMKKNKPSIY